MRTGRPIPVLTLSNEERVTLEQWARRPKTTRVGSTSAYPLGMCGWPNKLGGG